VVDPAEMKAEQEASRRRVDEAKKMDYYDEDDDERYDDERYDDERYDDGEDEDEDGEYEDDEDERRPDWNSLTEEEQQKSFADWAESEGYSDLDSLPQEQRDELWQEFLDSMPDENEEDEDGESEDDEDEEIVEELTEEEEELKWCDFLDEEGHDDYDALSKEKQEELYQKFQVILASENRRRAKRVKKEEDPYTKEGNALLRAEEDLGLHDVEKDLEDVTDQEKLLLFDNEWFLQKMRRGIFERKSTKKKRDFLDELMENAWFESPKTSSGSYEVYFRNPAAKSLKFPKPRPLEQLLHSVEPRLTGIDRKSPGYKKGVQVWNILLKNPYYTWKQKEEMSENAAKEWNDYHQHIKKSEAEGYQADEIFQRDFRRGRPYRARKEQEALDARMLANQKVRAHRSTETDWEVEAVEDEDELFK
jgi:hypothetical protein